MTGAALRKTHAGGRILSPLYWKILAGKQDDILQWRCLISAENWGWGETGKPESLRAHPVERVEGPQLQTGEPVKKCRLAGQSFRYSRRQKKVCMFMLDLQIVNSWLENVYKTSRPQQSMPRVCRPNLVQRGVTLSSRHREGIISPAPSSFNLTWSPERGKALTKVIVN